VPAALAELAGQYESGADPVTIVADLAGYVHVVTRLKIVPGDAADPTLSEAERVRGQEFAAALSVRVLTRAWQILLKGLAEVQGHSRPLAAAEMLVVRLAYAADLPTPDEVLKRLKDQGSGPAGPGPGAPAPRGGGGGGSAASVMASGAPRLQAVPAAQSAPVARAASDPAPGLRIRRFEDIAAIAAEKRDIALRIAVERDLRLVSFEEGRIEVNIVGGGADIVNRLSRTLQGWTGQRWVVAISQAEGGQTLQEREQARRADDLRGVRANPAVRALLESFPGAEIVAVRLARQEAASGDDDEAAPVETVPVDPDDGDDL